jgi:hypothetical protein
MLYALSLCLLICFAALNPDWHLWLAEFPDDFSNERVRFVWHPASMSFAPGTKQGCPMRPLALADNRMT